MVFVKGILSHLIPAVQRPCGKKVVVLIPCMRCSTRPPTHCPVRCRCRGVVLRRSVVRGPVARAVGHHHCAPSVCQPDVGHPNATLNPTFSGFHRVILWYCDGTSFAGALDHPIVNSTDGKNVTLYFRGRAVLDALLGKLKKDYGAAAVQMLLLPER